MCSHVLVVDDDRAICDLLQEALTDEAYEVDIANDGLIAWEKLVQHPWKYEAILLDIHMPLLDGLQLIQMLQKQQRDLLSSIIVLSSDYDGIREAIGLGAGHALEKPFDLDAVLETVSRIGQLETVPR